ncbi:hypothetical protein BU26DRAFT_92515 [Trematosphaeria pertusa]|uniref:Uncharacterized protein n=1 Tax=Trematosphaeria pertusa TaxID=390896 RepID=A0A6A6I255_9PLEO|nr:uncharacterized protein BU26DRAFT_92515 [Trematosphaeria pertusa]KAF2244052.1 hypothetical protein BU26DRAFT_92515 [Trematosphaeria pertusa]
MRRSVVQCSMRSSGWAASSPGAGAAQVETRWKCATRYWRLYHSPREAIPYSFGETFLCQSQGRRGLSGFQGVHVCTQNARA